MKIFYSLFCAILCFGLSFSVISEIAPAAFAAEKFIVIGTAGEHGVYYPAGGAICRLVKRRIKEHGVDCFVESTSGSVYNLNALHDGKFDLALAQTDWLYHAYRGTGEFALNNPDNSLRSVFSLHTEVFTVLARDDSGIATIRDLKNKRIGIGDDGSGMRATTAEVFKAEGWDKNSFAAMLPLKPAEQRKALCSGKVDVLLFATGHPNGNTEDITHKCKTHLISVTGPQIDKLLAENPYYLRVSLPGDMYPGSPNTINTFGVKAVLVTSDKVPEDTVYQVVKAVFDNLDNFKTLHPVFSTLDKKRMVSEGLIVPLHPGALKYYKEVGLIQ
jgi:TRAP transporter TAXI family solute receptor